MSKYYNVQTFSSKPVQLFTPKVPRTTMQGEDKKTPRICVCPSIMDCLNAVWFSEDKDFKTIFNVEYHLFPILTVYEFNAEQITEGNLLPPDQIGDRVPDVSITNEHWVINQDLVPNRIYAIQPKDISLARRRPRSRKFKFTGCDWGLVEDEFFSGENIKLIPIVKKDFDESEALFNNIRQVMDTANGTIWHRSGRRFHVHSYYPSPNIFVTCNSSQYFKYYRQDVIKALELAAHNEYEVQFCPV